MNRRSPPSPSRRGVTLIEVLVSLAIVGVLLAVATPSLSDFMERRRVVATANDIADIFHYARSEINQTADRLTLHLEVDPSEQVSCAAVVTQANVDKCNCHEKPVCNGGGAQLLRHYQIDNASGVSFKASADSWGTNQTNTLKLTNRQTMMDATGVQINVKGRRSGAQMRLDVNALGRVRMCSPGGSIGGYPQCS
jgi:type IV fimbrial biogenesis protein FimT